MVRSGCGRVVLHWPVCRQLRVAEHETRRDRANRLVVRLQLHNHSDEDCAIAVYLRFQDSPATLKDGPGEAEVIPPGDCALIEWTAYSPEAATYVVDVEAASWRPW